MDLEESRRKGKICQYIFVSEQKRKKQVKTSKMAGLKKKEAYSEFYFFRLEGKRGEEKGLIPATTTKRKVEFQVYRGEVRKETRREKKRT